MIKVFENIIDDHECDVLVNWVSENIKTKGRPNLSQSFSYKQVNHYNVDDVETWCIMEKYRWKASQYAVKNYEYETLYPEYTDLVIWYEGDSMDLHADNFNCNGDVPFRNDLYFRKISCLLYLNDDYEGGEIFFKNGQRIKPKKGMMVMFPSDCEYMHGVSKIEKGTRYTMPMWLTDVDDVSLVRIKRYYSLK